MHTEPYSIGVEEPVELVLFVASPVVYFASLLGTKHDKQNSELMLLYFPPF